MYKGFILSVFFFLSLLASSYSQTDSTITPNYKTRKVILASSTGLFTIGSLAVLHQAWYNEYNTGKFHFFNDNKEWLQIDKAGHVYSTYQAGRLMMNAFEWAGYKKKQKIIIGASIGLVYMTAVEVMDGFSRGWGYSWGDQLANVFGTSMAISQEYFWNQQRIQLKFSFAKSGLAQYHPALLGKSFSTQILKDYNAQTYWASVNPSTFIKKENTFPKWLNIALGYSAYGMLGGFENKFVVKDDKGNVLKIERHRRLYLSLDVDLTRIKTKSKLLKHIFSVVNILKFPAPAIELSKNKFRFYYLYY